MPEFRCKRCNRILKNKESIERGYGVKCYKIIQLNNIEKLKPEINDEIAFLKCEIKTLKRMLRNIQINGGAINPIERIKQVEKRPEQNTNTGNMANVVSEMKVVFTEDFNYHNVLSPINPIEELVSIPMSIEIVN